MTGPIKAALKLHLPDFLPQDRWAYCVERQDYQHITGFTMTRERLEDAELPPNTSFEHVIAWMDAQADEWYAKELRDSMGEPTQQESLAEEPRDVAAETEADILQEAVGTFVTMIAAAVSSPFDMGALDFSNSSKASAFAEGSIALPASSDTLLEHLKELGFKAKLKMLPKSDHVAPVTVVNPPSASEGAPSYITFNGQTFAVKNFKVIPSKDDPTGPGPLPSVWTLLKALA